MAKSKKLGKSCYGVRTCNPEEVDDDLLQVIVEGLIGEGAALEFMAFIEWSGKAPDVEKMLAGEIKATIPKRPDQRYAMLQQ